jgi:hypothetical protein
MVRKSTLEGMDRLGLDHEEDEDSEVTLVNYTAVPPTDFIVHVRGIRPLLVNRFFEKKSVKGVIEKPEKVAEDALYKDKKGKIYLPAEHFEGALIKAAKGMPMPGMGGKKTYLDEVAQNVIVYPQNVPFKVPKNPDNYEIDARAVVMKGLGRRMAHRPRWDEWEFEFTVRYDASFGVKIDRDVLTELLQRAGKIGVGTYRLKFGKFIVVSVTEKK